MLKPIQTQNNPSPENLPAGNGQMAKDNQSDMLLIGTRIHKSHTKTIRLLAVEAGYATVAQWLRFLIVREIEKSKESA